MRILAVGGGSGGHVTPVVAVLRVLKAKHPEVDIRFWCDTKFYSHARGIIHHFDADLPVEKIYSGKLRRYHTFPWWQHLVFPSILLPNLRDLFLVVIGFFQSLAKLVWWRPDVVFTKGGFVCLPVGLAATLLGIPLVIHDSDAHPGLTNRLLARWARRIATGAPLEHYNYPKSKSRYVGIPVAAECVPFTPEEQVEAKKVLGVDAHRPLVVITGGGLGAKRINDAVVRVLDDLLLDVSVVLISGSGQYDSLKAIIPPKSSRQFQLHAFVTPMAPVLGAADIVVARAGATTLLELAAMAKPSLIIPNAALTGGHQLKNAAVYAERQAARIIDENVVDQDPRVLVREIRDLLVRPEERSRLAAAMLSCATPHAADDLADMIVAVVRQRA